VLFFFTGSPRGLSQTFGYGGQNQLRGQARIVALVARMVQEVDQNDKRPSYAVAKSGLRPGERPAFVFTWARFRTMAKPLTDCFGRRARRFTSRQSRLESRRQDCKARRPRGAQRLRHTYALGEMKAGQEYEIEIMRGGQALKLKLTPAARK